jgi:ABC-type bacteriocin/lantibiotic exporter with double-glycine peptidase domain
MSIKKKLPKRFPFIQQRDAAECGSTCLAMIFKYHGLYNIQSTLRDLSAVTREGTSMLALSNIAEAAGFTTAGYRINFDTLSRIPLPCIAHYEGRHFVVIYRASKDRVWIADPAYGKADFTRDAFDAKWNGIVLTLEPTSKVFKNRDLLELVASQKGKERLVSKRFYLSLLYPLKFVVGEVLLLSLFLQLLGLALPFFSQSIIDRVLVYQDKKLLLIITLGMLGICAAQLILAYTRNALLTQFKVRFELVFFTNFFDHFIRLKQSYFDNSRREDFITRFQQHLRFRRILSPGLIQPFIDLLFAFNFMLVLFLYNVPLATIVCVSVLLQTLISIAITPRLRRLESKIFHDDAETLRGFIDTMLGAQSVKLLRLEKIKLWEWSNIYRKSLNRVLEGELTYSRLQAVLKVLSLSSQVAVYWLGALMAFRGELSIGQYVAFIAIFTIITNALNNVFSLWSMLAELSVSYSKLNQVLMAEPECDVTFEQTPERGKCEKIEIKDLSFRYSERSEAFVLKNLNLVMHKGDRIAVVGRNGSGKTTLAKILTQLYKDYEGSIFINDIELRDIHPQAWRAQVSMVPQQVYIFAGTIKENIALAKPNASMADIMEAARLADLHEFIGGLYLGYNHRISEDMFSLSGGQRLKIGFARLFLSNPDVIILDEASSALDVESESRVMLNLNRRFSDKIIISIAHRIHTIKDAHKILVLEDGALIEQGTHAALIEKRGVYHRFVSTYFTI